MNEILYTLGLAAGVSLAWTLLAAFFLTNVRRLGEGLSALCRRAPVLDLIVAGVSWIPWVIVGVVACRTQHGPDPVFGVAGWGYAVAGCIIGQVIGVWGWGWGHELANREKVKGPRIVRYLNRRVGRVRNHAALWVTALAYPIFWAIRFGEVFVYPMLVWTIRLPRYNQAEWVNVSRTKFDGLIGHDLIWCLYCDWMTGVYSLGAEMLRNVESFWCPIRFYDGKKCENCKVDFPDIDGGWAPADGAMKDVVAAMEKHYDQGDHSWFGHPRRKIEKVQITLDGKPTDPQ